MFFFVFSPPPSKMIQHCIKAQKEKQYFLFVRLVYSDTKRDTVNLKVNFQICMKSKTPDTKMKEKKYLLEIITVPEFLYDLYAINIVIFDGEESILFCFSY